MSHGRFNMAQKRNVRACNASQSHHQGPKFCSQKFKIKKTLITLFDKYGVITKEFVPDSQRVNSGVIWDCRSACLWCGHNFEQRSVCSCCTTRPLSHSALAVKIFLAKHGVVEISHSPYSPELVPADYFFSFLTWKLSSRKGASGCWRH